MRSNQQRINIIIGQLEGIKRALEDKKTDCFLLINQLKAVNSATAAVLEKVILEKFNDCLTDKEGQKKANKLLKEIIKNNN